MILSFLFYVFVFYLGFRLLFDFIIPIFRTTQKIKKSFREMHQNMQQQAGPFSKQEPTEKTSGKNNNDKKQSDEYIDFEEVK
jgi:hypothetical protein